MDRCCRGDRRGWICPDPSGASSDVFRVGGRHDPQMEERISSLPLSTDPFPSGFERTSGTEHTRGEPVICQPGIGCRGLVQESTSCCDVARTRGGDAEAEDESVKLRTYRFASLSSKAFPHRIELGRRVMRQINPNDAKNLIREKHERMEGANHEHLYTPSH